MYIVRERPIEVKFLVFVCTHSLTVVDKTIFVLQATFQYVQLNAVTYACYYFASCI